MHGPIPGPQGTVALVMATAAPDMVTLVAVMAILVEATDTLVAVMDIRVAVMDIRVWVMVTEVVVMEAAMVMVNPVTHHTAGEVTERWTAQAFPLLSSSSPCWGLPSLGPSSSRKCWQLAEGEGGEVSASKIWSIWLRLVGISYADMVTCWWMVIMWSELFNDLH